MFRVPESLFELLVARRDQWIQEKLPGCDSDMVSTLLLLHKVPDVVSVFCCQGHSSVENKARGFKGRDLPYITFAVRNDGLEFLEAVYGQFQLITPDTDFLRMEINQLGNIFDDRFGKTYTAITFRGDYLKSPKEMKDWNRWFRSAIIEAVKVHNGNRF